MAITPYLLYEDVGAARRFLSRAFGFRNHGRAMMGPDRYGAEDPEGHQWYFAQEIKKRSSKRAARGSSK